MNSFRMNTMARQGIQPSWSQKTIRQNAEAFGAIFSRHLVHWSIHRQALSFISSLPMRQRLTRLLKLAFRRSFCPRQLKSRSQ